MPPVARIPASRMLDEIRAGHFPWWYPDKARNLAVDYFVYGTDFIPLGANGTTTNSININGDSAFMILSAVLVETDITNLIFLPASPLLFALSEAGGARNLSNTPIHADNWFGTAQEPKYWDIPKLLMPNSTFNVQAQNLDAVSRNVRVAFHGFKIFGFRP